MSASRRAAPIFIAFLVCLVGASALLYAAESRAAGHGDPLVMPLDDTYIHFQYARMIAGGQVFRYIPGDPPTSGATSLLYPFLLAIGYRIGFQGTALALWALALGTAAWVGSTVLVYRLVAGTGSVLFGALVAATFALAGGLSWAFMSGMETGLTILAVLLTLWFAARSDLRGALAASIFAALMRPEGLVIALGIAGYFALGKRLPRRHWPVLIIPIAAGLLQPLLNALLTGSLTASGMQAKSYLANVPFDIGIALSTIVGVFLRTWGELFTGTDRDGIVYNAVILCLLAALAFAGAALRLRAARAGRSGTTEMAPVWPPPLTAMLIFWMIGLTAASSILETAFWQFKRYQQPVYALLFVLAGGGLVWLSQRGRAAFWVALVAACFLLAFSAGTGLTFLGYYRDNVNEIAALQIPMARFVATNTPAGARIAVHDIGVMAYLGDRETYDVVGLSTPGAALAWRSGPGAVFEQMRDSPLRPDYFAIYDEPHGLNYFTQSALFAQTLAVFPSTRPAHNVASAADRQIVTHIDWSRLAPPGGPMGSYSLTAVNGFSPVDSVDVGALDSEARHAYRWWDRSVLPGYATEFFEQSTLDCGQPNCDSADGGRLLNGGEEMTIATQPGKDLIWIIRVHPREYASVKLSANGQAVGARVQPGDLGGRWLEIAALIPGSQISGSQIRLRVDVSEGVYMPYQHWFFQGSYSENTQSRLPAVNARFEPGILLSGARLTMDAARRELHVDLDWRAEAEQDRGDAKLFVHLYKDVTQPPIVQYDNRVGRGTLPPANWLPGILSESISLPLPNEPGVYQVAVGWYDPRTQRRLPLVSGGAGQDDRLFLGSVTVEQR